MFDQMIRTKTALGIQFRRDDGWDSDSGWAVHFDPATFVPR